MKKILITGASGFIGRQCLNPLLEKGYTIHALSPKPLPEFKRDIVWHCQNFLDDEKTKSLVKTIQPSHCLHFAWYTEPGKYWSSQENLRWTASSILLFQSFYQQGGERFIGAGTCAEYRWQDDLLTEKGTPLEPTSLYGICKNALQKMIMSFSEINSLSSAWGRIFFLYGPHEHPERLIPTVVHSLLRNEKVLCSHGNQVRDFMHVHDVANAFIHLLESDIKGAVNIASGKPVFIKDVINTIAGQLNGSDNIRLGALPEKDEPAFITADISRLQNEVGYIPKFNLESGLKQTIEWWKKRLAEKSI